MAVIRLEEIARMKSIVPNPAAAKALDELPDDVRTRITDALHTYANDGTGDTKAMRGTPTVRLRFGYYRVIFDETATTITVLALGHRKDIYR